MKKILSAVLAVAFVTAAGPSFADDAAKAVEATKAASQKSVDTTKAQGTKAVADTKAEGASCRGHQGRRHEGRRVQQVQEQEGG